MKIMSSKVMIDDEITTPFYRDVLVGDLYVRIEIGGPGKHDFVAIHKRSEVIH